MTISKEIERVIEYKPYLFTIAYNMLGDVDAAQDLVQDVFEKWIILNEKNVEHPKAYLSRMTINMAIDKLKQLKSEREHYKGLWMPVPLLEPPDVQRREHTLEYGILLLLENLNPYERAVFVLKEAFDFSHEEVVSMLELSIENSRQLLHRAKEKIKIPKKRKPADPEKSRKLLEAFLMALHQNDFKKLESFLIEDIVLYSDGGGKVAAALKPIVGVHKVVKFLKGIAKLDPDAAFSIEPVLVNTDAGILLFRNKILDAVIQGEYYEGKITKLFFLRNPEKIKGK